MTETWTTSAFGLEIVSDLALPGFRPGRGAGTGSPLALRRAAADEIPGPQAEPRWLRNLQAYDGAPYAMLESATGDILFLYGRSATFALSADLRELTYSVAEPDDPRWQRVLLDTMLWAISQLRGCELLHASAIVDRGRLLVFTAAMGGGKSSLATEFLRRGASLFSDDVVALQFADAGVTAHPGPPLMNVPEQIDPANLGSCRVVAELGDERWVAFDREPPQPQQISAIILLDRGASAPMVCARVSATALDLLPYAIVLPHLHERARARFALFSALVETVPVLRLSADLTVTPERLADLIGQALT